MTRRPRGRRRWLGALAAALLLAVAGALLWRGVGRSPLGGPAAGPVTPAASPTGSGTLPPGATTPPGGAHLKPAMVGLIDRQGFPADDYRPVVSGVVVDATWDELQPAPGATIVAGNPIDAAITEVRALNRAQPDHQMALKLRVFAGIHAPEWAKELGGSPVSVTDPVDNVTGTIGRFWTDEYGRAYADLEAQLAARYDGVPEIREVTIARCTTVYDEPFIRDRQDPATVQALLDAGFTVSADVQCLREQVDAHDVWQTTRSGLALNPYQRIDATQGRAEDEPITDAMMGYCRQRLGARCVLENDSLRSPPLAGAYTAMYQRMEAFGAPISIQTATPRKVGDLAATVQIAVALGASAVELPRGDGGLTPTQLEPLSRALLAVPFG